jgi:murein DD-endopeptidase MepM/ murein hydrolase activator NlpD
MLKKILLIDSLPSYIAFPNILSRMRSLRLRFLTLLSLLFFFVFFSSPCLRGLEVERITTPSGVIIELTYSTFQPGEMIVVSIQNNSAVKSGQVWFLGGKYFLGRNQSNTGLLAFIGLNLDLKPGSYTMKIFIEKVRGWESVEKQIQVIAKEFPIKRLWVPEKYIKPPPEFRDRIKVEAEILGIIYGTETDRWLGEGQFILPCSGELFPNFGQRRIYNNEVDSVHTGVDISEAWGAPVKASNSGRVALANNLYFSGNTIIIDHGIGLFTIYCHFSRMKVKRGEMVKKGQIIGYIGATGRAVGPHLHWAVNVFGKSIDPLSLLSFNFD